MSRTRLPPFYSAFLKVTPQEEMILLDGDIKNGFLQLAFQLYLIIDFKRANFSPSFFVECYKKIPFWSKEDFSKRWWIEMSLLCMNLARMDPLLDKT